MQELSNSNFNKDKRKTALCWCRLTPMRLQSRIFCQSFQPISFLYLHQYPDSNSGEFHFLLDSSEHFGSNLTSFYSLTKFEWAFRSYEIKTCRSFSSDREIQIIFNFFPLLSIALKLKFKRVSISTRIQVSILKL